MYCDNWLDLPIPAEIDDPYFYVAETCEETNDREGRQVAIANAIDERGVGHAAFESVDGWTDRPRDSAEQKRFSEACAEWADGEIAAAHIAYRNDILCTSDRAGNAHRSIFNDENRAWLTATFGVAFLSQEELRVRLTC